MNARVDVLERFDEEKVTAVLSLVEAATEADGVRPLNEEAMLHLRYWGRPGARAVLIYDGDDLAGVAHLNAPEPADPADPAEGPSGELVVHPAFRGRGLGRRLAEAVLEDGGGRIRLWAHGDHPAAARIAAALGLSRSRSLWQMRRPTSVPTADPVLPGGLRLRTFAPGTDEGAWLALNALAFASHPEQGSWTVDDIEHREREPWFDPAGFFLAVRQDGTLAGFHWTKVHLAGEDGGHEPVGEVYVVGVDPAEQGTGLGRALTLAGLVHLRSLGLAQVLLYVDEENQAAIRLYESLGFTRWSTDVMYRR